MKNKNVLIIDDLAAIYPEHVWINFSDAEQEIAWQQTIRNNFTCIASRHRAFINCLCLNVLIKWLQEEPDLQSKIEIPTSLSELYQRWEFVNGTELIFNHNRLVLIPHEQSYIDELRIPQEWVDIPNWAANYYVALQVNLEAGWLHIWGFISYAEVLQKAKYDLIDRTYCLNHNDLMADINIMWVAQEIFTPKQPQIKSLPNLSAFEANKIISKLSQPTVYSPRLHINFAVWGAIIASNEYRQNLYHQRTQNFQIIPMESSTKITHNLSLWFKNLFHEGWHSIDDLLNLTPMNVSQFRSDSVLNEVCIKGAKIIDLGMQIESQNVVLLIGLSPQNDHKVAIRVQLYPALGENHLPSSIKLALLSESGAILQSVESRNYDNYIQLKRFKLPLGKLFSLQVAHKDVTIKENFILEEHTCSEI